MGEMLSPARLAELLEEAPAWVLLGLTAPSPRMRAQATDELARHLCARLADPAQLALPLR